MAVHLHLEPPQILGDTLEVAATLHLPAAPQRLWYRLPLAWRGAVTPWADPFVIAFLFPLLRGRHDLRVEAAVSPSLLANLEAYMAVWHRWEPRLYQPVTIHAAQETEAPPPAVPGRTLALASGGLDSSYTLLRHHRRLLPRRSCHLAAAICVHGLADPVDARDHASSPATLWQAARALTASLHLPLLPITTNFRQMDLNWVHVHGTALGAVLHLCKAQFDTALVPNSVPYEFLPPIWGSHPLTDPLLSSRHFQVLDDGGETPRPAKAALLASWPEALAHLHVCEQPLGRHANCCRCEKCLRTILAFYAAGLPRPPAFPTAPTPRDIRRIRLNTDLGLAFWEQIRQAAREGSHQRAPWARAARTLLRRNYRRRFFGRLKRPLIPLRNWLRTLFRGSPLSQRQRTAAAPVRAAAPESKPQPPELSSRPNAEYNRI